MMKMKGYYISWRGSYVDRNGQYREDSGYWMHPRALTTLRGIETVLNRHRARMWQESGRPGAAPKITVYAR